MKVTVIGDAMLDRTKVVKANRLSSESDSSVIYDLEYTCEELGGAANVAANLFGLGLNTTLLASVARDADGQQFADLFATHRKLRKGDFCQFLIECQRTTVKERVRTKSSLLYRVDYDGGEPLRGRPWCPWDVEIARLNSIVERVDVEADLYCVVDYGRGFLSQALQHRDVSDRLDYPKRPALVEPSRHADLSEFYFKKILKLNIRQSEEIIRQAGAVVTPLNPNEVHREPQYNLLLQALHDALEVKEVGYVAVIVTLGAGGMFAFTSRNGNLHPIHRSQPLETVKVLDPCGAGDTALAVVASHLVKTEPGEGPDWLRLWIPDALDDAVMHCAKAVQVIGNYIPRK